MIDHGCAGSEACGDLSGQRTLVFTRDRAPKEDLPTAYDDTNFGGVDLAVLVHFLFDAGAHLRVRWGNLAHSRGLIGRVHAATFASHVPARPKIRPRRFDC